MKKFILVLLIVSALFIMAAKKPKPPQGIAGYMVIEENHLVQPRTADYIQVFCPVGKVVTGGGFYGPSYHGMQVTANHPGPENTSWLARVHNNTEGEWEVSIFAICADVAQ